MQLSENLIALRNKMGLSQEEAAKKLSLTRGGYANYEIGSRTPSIEILARIADFYNVDIDYLVGHIIKETGEFSNLSSDEITLLQLYRSVPSKYKDMVTRMIRSALETQGLS